MGKERSDSPAAQGILNYFVIECADIACPLTLEYHEEVRLKTEGVTRHRYIRYMRFKYTIDRLCGNSRVIIPSDIVQLLEDELFFDEVSPENVWELLRAALKKHGLKRFYDRIPCLITYLGYPWKIHMTSPVMNKILRDFQEMSDTFNELQRGGIIEYQHFPNLRYIALKLMEKYQVEIDFYIPFVRVKKVYEKLELIREML